MPKWLQSLPADLICCHCDGPHRGRWHESSSISDLQTGGLVPTPERSFPQLIPGVPLNSQQAQEGFQTERGQFGKHRKVKLKSPTQSHHMTRKHATQPVSGGVMIQPPATLLTTAPSCSGSQGWKNSQYLPEFPLQRHRETLEPAGAAATRSFPKQVKKSLCPHGGHASSSQ